LKKAIKDSTVQIYGAERNLAKAITVIRGDGSIGLPLPQLTDRKIHRISISLGAESKLLIPSGDFGKGFIHILDENPFIEVLTELDIITDFTSFFEEKEKLITKYPGLILIGGEKNLLSVYIYNGMKFPEEPPPTIIESNYWEILQSVERYQQGREADKRSYTWDYLIENVAKDVLAGEMEFGNNLSDNEIVLRYLAKENRIACRLLSDSFKDFLVLARSN